MHPCRLRQRAQDLLHAIQGPGQQWRVVTIGRGAHGSERMPSASTPTERLMPPFPRSTGLLPDLSPPQGALVMQQSTAISERRATRAREASAISAMRGSSVSPGSVPGGQGNGKFSKQSRLLQVGLPPSLPSPCRGEFARAQTSWALEWSTPKKGSITVHLPPERHFAYGGACVSRLLCAALRVPPRPQRGQGLRPGVYSPVKE